jgi:hypothetical protein
MSSTIKDITDLHRAVTPEEFGQQIAQATVEIPLSNVEAPSVGGESPCARNEVVAFPASVIVSEPLSHGHDSYYYPERKSFIQPTQAGRFTEMNDAGAKRFLSAHGAEVGDWDSLLFEAQYRRTVSYIGPLAG